MYLTTFRDCTAIVLENERVGLTVLPDVGGKIISIRSRLTDREFLWQDDTRPLQTPRYGDSFGNYDISGFDDCFPTIAECAYPEYPWQGVFAPDHGELWCTPWQYAPQHDGVYLHTYGVRFPYHFEKWITLAPDTGRCSLRYKVSNLAPHDFRYTWAAHPLFAASKGMRIVLPGTPEMRFVFNLGDRVSGDYLESFRWPWIKSPSGEMVDYSLIGPASWAANDKVYADSEGWCALHDPSTGDTIGFSFPVSALPCLGICINHGGWPKQGVPGYWVALEPCTSYPDPLDQAIELGRHFTLKGLGSAEWSMTLHIGQADSADAVRRLMT